jgi:type IV pilus assembly protein PilM
MAAIPQVARDVTAIGLDIGTNLIKVVEMRSVRGSIHLLNVGIRPTPPEVISNGVIVEPQGLGLAIRGLLQQQGIRTRATVASVAGQSALVVRPIQVPKMARSELAETMRWEVERHIPFAASEVIMDYEPLQDLESIPEGEPNMDVLLAVAQEDLVNGYVETLRQAGLEPQALDIEPLAAQRSLVDMDVGDAGYHDTVALVNVGNTTTEISIIRNGLIAFTRPIPLAGESLTNAISEAMGRDVNEAERLKKQLGEVFLEAPPPAAAPPPPAPAAAAAAAPGPPSVGEEEGPVFDLSAELGREVPAEKRPDQVFDVSAPPQPTPAGAGAGPPAAVTPSQRVFQALQPALAELVTEIRRSLEYYASQRAGATVDRIVLYGGTARLPRLDRFVSREVGLPVEVGNPLKHMASLPAQFSARYLQEIGCLLPVAVGLCLRDMLE